MQAAMAVCMNVWAVNRITRAVNTLNRTDVSRAYSKNINDSQFTMLM